MKIYDGKQTSRAKQACLCAMFVALCYVLPVAFHAFGAGAALSPMHLPVLLCGLLCGPLYGAFCGLIGPCISSALSGMPAPTMLVSMIPELIAYGAVSGVLMRVVRTGSTFADLYLSLVPAMLAGRVIGGAAKALFYLSNAKSYSVALWASGYFAETLPGAIIQLAVIPALIFALMKARLIPERYPKESGAEK